MAMRQSLGNPTYDAIVCGEFCNSDTAAHQLPDVPVRMVEIQAKSGNTGIVYVGGVGATKPDGTTDVTTGLEFLPGQSRILFVADLNVLYMICVTGGDGVTYLGYL